MRVRPESFLVFALLGSPLLAYLAFPLGYLLFDLDWRQLGSSLANPGTLQAVQVSLITSGISTAIMTFSGVPLGYLLARARFRGRHLLTTLVFLPLVLPPLVGGVLLLLVYGPYGILGGLFAQHGIAFVNSLAGIVLAQIFFAAPYVVITSLSAFASIDERLEQAAATLGRSRVRIFFEISLPLARRGLVAGITLAWVRTLGEFGATLVMAYHPHTLPIFLWVEFTGAGLHAALPLALLLVTMAGGAMLLLYLFGRLPDLLPTKPHRSELPPL